MKTRVVILLGLLALAVAPAPTAAQFRFSGGVNLTDFFGGDVGETEQSTGLNMGASFPVMRFGPVQIVAEGYYRQKGATQSIQDLQAAALAGDLTNALTTFEIGLDYIEIPILARIDLPVLGGRILPYLAGGPALAWKIDCGVKADALTASSDVSCDDFSSENLGETLRDYERGLVVGGGIDLAVGSMGAVNIDARLTRGLSRLSEGQDGPDVKNQAFSVMLGYSLGLPGGFGGE